MVTVIKALGWHLVSKRPLPELEEAMKPIVREFSVRTLNESVPEVWKDISRHVANELGLDEPYIRTPMARKGLMKVDWNRLREDFYLLVNSVDP